MLLDNFYSAFSRHDAASMAKSYHVDAVFQDPVFGTLRGVEIGAMWQMLIERSGGKLNISFAGLKADEKNGSVNWIANYEFSKTGRKVTNCVLGKFVFKNGLIYRHADDFNFHRWAQQALGFKGWLLGRTRFLKNKVRKQALHSLARYQKDLYKA